PAKKDKFRNKAKAKDEPKPVPIPAEPVPAVAGGAEPSVGQPNLTLERLQPTLDLGPAAADQPVTAP
ncbi:MAG: hypothetical protein AB7V22_11150, partial [Kiritimatiellia bacterium]